MDAMESVEYIHVTVDSNAEFDTEIEEEDNQMASYSYESVTGDKNSPYVVASSLSD
jgi:hypothetical protein